MAFRVNKDMSMDKLIQEYQNAYLAVNGKPVMLEKHGSYIQFPIGGIRFVRRMKLFKRLEVLRSRPMTCPQCTVGDIKIPNGYDIYCEDCGWPDEDFDE